MNRVLSYLYEGSLEITITVPLRKENYNKKTCGTLLKKNILFATSNYRKHFEITIILIKIMKKKINYEYLSNFYVYNILFVIKDLNLNLLSCVVVFPKSYKVGLYLYLVW